MPMCFKHLQRVGPGDVCPMCADERAAREPYTPGSDCVHCGTEGGHGRSCPMNRAEPYTDISPADAKRAAMTPPKKPLNPWHPMTRPIDLKHLGKLGEELGECGAAVARCIIQGIDEKEPVTGKPNREWLEEEIADVIANIQLVMAHFALDFSRIEVRRSEKKVGLRAWHQELE